MRDRRLQKNGDCGDQTYTHTHTHTMTRTLKNLGGQDNISDCYCQLKRNENCKRESNILRRIDKSLSRH